MRYAVDCTSKANIPMRNRGTKRQHIPGKRAEQYPDARKRPDVDHRRVRLQGICGTEELKDSISPENALSNIRTPESGRMLITGECVCRGYAELKLGEEMVEKKENSRNQRLMQLVRRAHGLVENPDIEKHRQSQNHIGEILGNTKEIHYEEFHIGEMDAEWVSVNRAHMKKYVILYCHGGGYSTGSRKYARTLTSKLASSTFMDVLCFDYRLAPEHPYPAALEDALKAWDYLMLLGYGAREVIVAGDSAGGNLALALALKLKEQKRLLPRGLVLMSPWTDLTLRGILFRHGRRWIRCSMQSILIG